MPACSEEEEKRFNDVPTKTLPQEIKERERGKQPKNLRVCEEFVASEFGSEFGRIGGHSHKPFC